MFEKASRLKLRFPHKGVCSVEDLWDLPLTSLDSIFMTLNAQLKAQKEESLLTTRSSEDEELDLQISIIEHVVGTRLVEREARKTEKERKAKKEKLLELIAEKQDESLKSMSIEELTNMVNAL